MSDDDRLNDPLLVPFFGCMPHVPERTRPELERFPDGKRLKTRPCRTCGGGQPDGSPFVCSSCHAVAPSHQARLDLAKIDAISTREPERNLMRRAADDMLVGGRSILTVDERAELIKQYKSLALTWLDSIGQPLAQPETKFDAELEPTPV